MAKNIFPIFEGVTGMADFHPFRSAQAKERCIAAIHDFEKSVWPIQSKSVVVETSFGKTFVRVSGPESAPPLVLLHGMGTNSLMWSSNIKELSEKHRTYAVDTINDYGLSIRSRHMRNPEDFANWLDELFSGLNLEDPTNLMGMSYGGWLAGQFALRFQTRLEKMVLLAPASLILPLKPEFYVRMMLQLLPSRHFKKSFMDWLMGDVGSGNESGFSKASHFHNTLFQCYKPDLPPVRPTVLSDKEWQGFELPVLVLLGENEKIYSPQKAVDRLTRIAPHIQKDIIPEAGHFLIAAQPDRVNKQVLAFLEN
jgi:pimeloyl-ACP methyl ester carboxylesterase